MACWRMLVTYSKRFAHDSWVQAIAWFKDSVIFISNEPVIG
jgi:hypothetical protein